MMMMIIITIIITVIVVFTHHPVEHTYGAILVFPIRTVTDVITQSSVVDTHVETVFIGRSTWKQPMFTVDCRWTFYVYYIDIHSVPLFDLRDVTLIRERCHTVMTKAHNYSCHTVIMPG